MTILKGRDSKNLKGYLTQRKSWTITLAGHIPYICHKLFLYIKWLCQILLIEKDN